MFQDYLTEPICETAVKQERPTTVYTNLWIPAVQCRDTMTTTLKTVKRRYDGVLRKLMLCEHTESVSQEIQIYQQP